MSATVFYYAAIVSKLDVLRRCDPLQIIDAIILFVVIAVMNLCFVFGVGIRNECFSNSYVNETVSGIPFSIAVKVNVYVSVSRRSVCSKKFYFSLFETSRSAVIAYL